MTFHVDLHRQESIYFFSRSGVLSYGRLPKRCFDIALILLMLPIVLPLVLLLALLVATDGSAPFYRQRRIGRHGKVYRILKLRTMVPNAESRLQTHLENNAEARQEWALLQKLRCDPRVTRLGRILRKSSLDELPQLWNVLKGEMSLIGPRPMMVEQSDMYPGQAYFELRPGITGLWQVSDRNASRFVDRAAFDDCYAEQMSFRTDIGILLRTVAVVLRGTGC